MREPVDRMPYATLESLPPAIRADLSPQAQRVYVDAFNGAWRRYADFADREAFCHRLARLAIRRCQRSLVGSASSEDALAVSHEIDRESVGPRTNIGAHP
jgi:cation transport regulator ChaB